MELYDHVQLNVGNVMQASSTIFALRVKTIFLYFIYLF